MIELSDEAIMEPLWRLLLPFQKELTFTRWKDGIGIYYPTPELRALAEHFYRAGMAAMAEREGLKQDVIEAAKAMRVDIASHENLTLVGSPARGGFVTPTHWYSAALFDERLAALAKLEQT